LEWVRSSGFGTINSFSVVKRPAYPQLPSVYAVVAVEMDEGWFMMSNVVDCEVAEVCVDARVQVAFRSIEGMALPFMVIAP